MMKYLNILLLVIVISSMSTTADADSGCRYLWVVRNDLTSRKSIDVLLERSEISGANGLMVQVVGRAESYYLSSILPSADFDANFDPLEYIIIQARARGMEVHAWINAFLVWSAPYPPPNPEHIWHTHPEWFMADRFGISTKTYSREECDASGIVGATLSPAVPEVRAWLADIAVEIALKYDVTGIHLDYIRYPNQSFGFEVPAVAEFYLQTGRNPENMNRYSSVSAETDSIWQEWKSEQVTETVETIRAALRRNSPETLLSCAVMADPFDAVLHYSCNWTDWLEDGLIDFVCTMAYTDNAATAQRLAILETAICPEKVVYGIGIYNQSFASAIAGSEEALARGAAGICIFDLNSMTEEDAYMFRSFWDVSEPLVHTLDAAVFYRLFPLLEDY